MYCVTSNISIFDLTNLLLTSNFSASQSHSSTEDPYLFSNPVPPEMQPVPMADLAAVRMTLRPRV